MRVPIGDIFETWVQWLRETFGAFFDLISAILNYAITFLERVFLLEHSVVYPSVIFALLSGAVLFGLLRPRLGRVPVLVVAIAGSAVIFAVEVWRYQALEAKLEPAEARDIVSDLERFADRLETRAPEDYSAAIEVVEAIPEEKAERIQSEIQRAERLLVRLRGNRFDRAASIVEDILEAGAEAGWSDAELAPLETVVSRYRAFAVIDESRRVASRFERFDEPRLRINALNERTYSRLTEMMEEARILVVDDPETASLLDSLEKTFLTLNPVRLSMYPAVAMLILLSAVAGLLAGWRMAVFSVIGLALVLSMGLWVATMETLALVLSATLFALVVGVPVGVLAAQSNAVENAVKPVLDFMQTMPAFVYLIPAVLFFGLGKVPGAMATVIFAMPPAVRLTNLGIRGVPKEVVEAAWAFGATRWQLLLKAQLPIALPTILAGVNQTIMLALSMVVIGGMIGAGGLGEIVLSGITQMQIGLGFESGLAVVVLAIYLDRVTQALASLRKKR